MTRLPSRISQRPTVIAAAVLVLVGTLSVVVWALVKGSRDWTPNIATDAFSIALAITLIDAIVRREASTRLSPRTARVRRA